MFGRFLLMIFWYAYFFVFAMVLIKTASDLVIGRLAIKQVASRLYIGLVSPLLALSKEGRDKILNVFLKNN